MTNQHFTNGAKELANATGVLLWDREKLFQMMTSCQNGETNYIVKDKLDTDPKLLTAIELAVDIGKISTSLLQRKLEIGYGRAVKIINQMEELGIVSQTDGNKPRKILISKEDFIEKFVLSGVI